MITKTFLVGRPELSVTVTMDEAEQRVMVDPIDWSTSAGVTPAERGRVNAYLTTAMKALQA